MRRVALTGVGVVSPLGIGKEAFWSSLMSGRSASKHLSRLTSCDLYDGLEFASQVVSEVADYDPTGLPPEVQRLDRYIQFAVAGTQQALQDASLDAHQVPSDRLGISLSNAICGSRQIEAEYVAATDYGRSEVDMARIRSDLYLVSMSNTPSVILAAMTGAQGPSITLSTGCVGGVDAIGYGYDTIRYGEADVMIAGASEAPITPITTAAFDVLHCLSRSFNDRPEAASRPFDAGRDGFVLSEGCGIVILEDLERAVARGAPIYAEVSGFAIASNAIHMTDLLSDGADLARTIRDALAEAGVEPEQVGYVNAHGSSTPQNDDCETRAFKLVFGEHARRIPINSTKSMQGHALSAASAMEIIVCALTLQRGCVHPTINYERPDPSCDLDWVPNQARPWAGDVVVSNASGFGALHAAMVLTAPGRTP
jgi:3-oxoacyl-(acyl-carrier-protein) synthase